MNDPITPLITLVAEPPVGNQQLLPPDLVAAYDGNLWLPAAPVDRPLVLMNFVTTLDGAISFALPGNDTGAEISGHSAQDHVVMGILRACADAIIWGAGTYAATRRFLATPAAIMPPFAEAYAALTLARGGAPAPLAVILTRSGEIPRDGALLTQGRQPTLIVTTAAGTARLRDFVAPNVTIATVADDYAPGAILALLRRDYGIRTALLEGGPKIVGAFLSAGVLDTCFLTIAPQFAGRSDVAPRPALVAGQAFAPATAPWGQLVSLKRGGDLLFTRYHLGPEVRRP